MHIFLNGAIQGEMFGIVVVVVVVVVVTVVVCSSLGQGVMNQKTCDLDSQGAIAVLR